MPRSLARGDYRLALAIESASTPDTWYRQLVDVRSGALSCDCPRWLFARRRDAQRGCKHTAAAAQVLEQLGPSPLPPAAPDDSLIAALREQWPGLGGTWHCAQRDTLLGGDHYRFVLVQLTTPDGLRATGGVAFALAHHASVQAVQARVAGWCGFAIAAEIARQAGYPLAGQPPAHFLLPQRARFPRPRDVRGPVQVAIGLHDILHVGDHADPSDGLTPEQRAENTLRLFLGDLYGQLVRRGFLDVSSRHFTAEQRVYRLRRDTHAVRERRVRVFEHGQYVADLCIVRAQCVPVADHWLTVFLRLLSDELGLLSVVQPCNVFRPYSDGREAEIVPAEFAAAAEPLYNQA
jgi:hypothetical protein